jgi:hypothetical protein
VRISRARNTPLFDGFVGPSINTARMAPSLLLETSCATSITGMSAGASVPHPHDIEAWPLGRTEDGEQVLLSECALCGELVDLTA